MKTQYIPVGRRRPSGLPSALWPMPLKLGDYSGVRLAPPYNCPNFNRSLAESRGTDRSVVHERMLARLLRRSAVLNPSEQIGKFSSSFALTFDYWSDKLKPINFLHPFQRSHCQSQRCLRWRIAM